MKKDIDTEVDHKINRFKQISVYNLFTFMSCKRSLTWALANAPHLWFSLITFFF